MSGRDASGGAVGQNPEPVRSAARPGGAGTRSERRPVSLELPVVRKEMVVGYRMQTEWSWLIATAFFLGKVGAGLLAVSLFIDYPAGAFVGLLIAEVGKGTAHLFFLGRPERFWRVLLRPQTSWISRGLWGMLVMGVSGAVYLAVSVGWITLSGASWDLLLAVCSLSALVVMVYDGFVLRASPAIPIWRSALVPVMALSYSLLGGVTLATILPYVLPGEGPARPLSEYLEVTLIATNLALMLAYLLVMAGSAPAARRAVRQMVRGSWALIFLGGAVGVGLLVSLVLALYISTTGSTAPLALLALTDMLGHFLVFFVLLRSGLYSPVAP
jgi:formate-dependent nitrite reductase membrane component NrfD